MVNALEPDVSDPGVTLLQFSAAFGSGDVDEQPEVAEPLMTALRAGDPYAVGLALHNDLHAAALRLRPDR